MNPEKKYRWLIGIDPGVQTGYAIYDRMEGGFSILKTFQLHHAMLHFWDFFEGGNKTFVRVEDPRQATFGRSNRSDVAKMQGAGSVKRDAKIWDDYLKWMGVDYEMVRPNKKLTKWDAESFAKLTGHKEKCSQHARDAALLVWGL